MASPTSRYAIDPGSPVTVVFDGTTPDLVADFQRFIQNGETMVVTTPQGETDPSLQVVHYIEDYQYIAIVAGGAGGSPAVNNITEKYIGLTVEVRFTGTGANDTLTGTITDVGTGGRFAMDVGGVEHVVNDYWSFKVL